MEDGKGPEADLVSLPELPEPNLGLLDLLATDGDGKVVVGVIRSTCSVDASGKISYAAYNVKATGHVAKLRKDLSHLPQHGTFSHAIANPPYFDEGKSTPSPNILKAQAHAFGPEELEIWVKVMHTMVALRGTMTIVHRAETLGKILTAMDGRFGDIRIAPLYAREGTAASRVVVQGIKGSRAPMQLLPGLILHSEHSQFTADAEAVLRDGSAWRLR